MGSSTERQHSSSTNCSKGLHRGDQWQRRHLRVNTNLLRSEDATRLSTLQQLDLPHRRHLNSLSTCRSSNSRSLYVSTSRVLQRLRSKSFGDSTKPSMAYAAAQKHGKITWLRWCNNLDYDDLSASPTFTQHHREMHTYYATSTTCSSSDNRRRSTSCSRASSNTPYSVRQENSQSATPSAFWAETSATRVTTMRSVSRTATRQSC